MGLSEMLLPKGFDKGSGDTMTGPSGTAYPQNGFQIFLKDLMEDPMKVFDAYRRGSAVAPQMPNMVTGPTPTPSMPSMMTDEVAPQGVIEGPMLNELKKRKMMEELSRQI